MTFRTIALSLGLWMALVGTAFAQQTYHQTFGAAADEASYGIEVLDEGSAVHVGYTTAGGKSQALLLRIDKNGPRLWERVLQESSALRDVRLASDGLLYATGWMLQDGRRNFMVMKFDNTGSVHWVKVLQAEGEGYSIARYTASGQERYAAVGQVGNKAAVVAFDKDGNALGSYLYAGPSGQSIFKGSLYDQEAGWLVAAGETDANGTRDALMAHINLENGHLLRAFTYDSGKDEWANFVSPLVQKWTSSSNGVVTVVPYYNLLGGTTARVGKGADMLVFDPKTDGAIFRGAKAMGGDGDDEMFANTSDQFGMEVYVAGYFTAENGYKYGAAFPVDLTFNAEGGNVVGKCGNEQLIYDVDKLPSKQTVSWAGVSTISTNTKDVYALQNTDGWGATFGCHTQAIYDMYPSGGFSSQGISMAAAAFAMNQEAGAGLANGNRATNVSDLLAFDVCATNTCPLTVFLGPDVELCGGSATLVPDVNDCPSSYLWSTGETTETITVTAPGTYSVRVQQGACVATDEIVVTAADLGSKAGNIWYFGNRAGLDFSTGTPVALTNSAMVTGEGSTVVSDQDGNLLFYSDGRNVWNKNHLPMPNGTGLPGNSSSTHSAVAVPHPGNANLFFLFVIDADESRTGGLQYCMVDMRLNGGLGDVVTAPQKMYQLLGNAIEKLASVRHSNGRDHWVMSYNMADGRYYAYLITKDGLSATPVKNEVFFATTASYYALKFSPSGRKMASAWAYNSNPNQVEVFDFDATTGLLSNRATYPLIDIYGLEFSPNEQFLYAYSNTSPTLHQIDLSSGSRVQLGAAPSGQGGALQLGPDGKIYVVGRGLGNLYVIEEPNKIGADARFKIGPSLGGMTAELGLPTLAQSIFASCAAYIEASGTTVSCDKTVTLTTPAVSCATYEWLKDGAVVATGTDTAFTVSEAGSYQVRVKKDACEEVSVPIVISELIGSGKQGNIWYFGANAGLDFNTNPPTPLLDGQVSTWEGSSAIADENGKLVLYTDGVTVWNKNHQVMANGMGLAGDASSAQSGLIVPKPGTANIYYVFTVDGNTMSGAQETEGMNYSVIDMSRQGGLGEVIEKNVNLYKPGTERIAAVHHANKKDYWVVGHGWNSNDFYAYLVTEAGVAGAPVTTSIGAVSGGDMWNKYGILKFSSNGTKLAHAALGQVEIYNFDASTGKLSNLMVLSVPGHPEFSPSGRYLYTSHAANDFDGQIHQYDLQASDVMASRTLIGSFNTAAAAQMQLGPDGRIYVARHHFHNPYASGDAYRHLGVIKYPEKAGLASEYVHDGIYLGGRESRAGLPPFIQSFFAAIDVSITGNSTVLSCTVPIVLEASEVACATYQWLKDGADIPNATGLAYTPTVAGTYSVRAEVNGNTAVSNEIVVTGLIEYPTFDLGSDIFVCDGAPISVVLTAPAKEGVAYAWPDGSAGNTFTATAFGDYTVKANKNGCEAEDMISVKASTTPVVNLGADRNACTGDKVTLDAGNTGATFVWNTGDAGQSLEVASTGTYKVAVSNGTCSASDEVKVTFHAKPVNTMPATYNFCDGGSATLDAGNAGFQYQWSTGETSKTIQATQTSPYSVRIFNEFCEITATTQANAMLNPIVDLGADRTVCAGQGVLLDAGASPFGLQTYKWSTGATTQTINVANSGTYSVEVTNATGCKAMDEAKVSVVASPAVDLGANATICEGESLTLDAGNAGFQYQWNTGATTQTISVTQSGSYSVRVFSASCEAFGQKAVTVLPKPAVDLGADILTCQGLAKRLDAGNAGASFLWNTGATTQTMDINSNGTYSVTVTAGGCMATDEIKAEFVPLPSFDLGIDRAICAGSVEVLNAGIADPRAIYQWQDNAATPTYSVSQSGSYAVHVNVGECQTTKKVRIEVVPAPAVDLGADRVICAGQSLTLDAGNAGASFLWNTGATAQQISVDAAGTYSVEVSAGNCKAVDEVKVSVVASPAVDLGANATICEGESLTLDAGNAGFQYQWSNGATTQTISVTQSGNYTVRVFSASCEAFGQKEVVVRPKPVVNFGSDRTICEGTQTIFNAGAGFASYAWSTGATTQSITVGAIGSYEVAVTDADGCKGGGIGRLVAFYPKRTIDLGPDIAICFGDTAIFDAGPGFNDYTWQEGQSNSRTFKAMQVGQYRVHAVDENSCQARDTIEITDVYELPIIPLENTHISCDSGEAVLDAGDFAAYQWQDGSKGATFTATAAGDYSVTVTDILGCVNSRAITVADTCAGWAKFPNAFMPGGSNKVFRAVGKNIERLELAVYTRWGEVIFATSEVAGAWDGTYKGAPMPSGSYPFIARYWVRENGKQAMKEVKGVVALLR